MAAFADSICITRKTAKRIGFEIMYFVYVLSSEICDRLYIGSSADPDERLRSHNSGKVKSSRSYKPWKRVLLEQIETKSSALKREKYLKSGWGRKTLKKLI